MGPPVKRGLDGAALKWIALGSMLIDHIALILLLHSFIRPALPSRSEALLELYRALRCVGRWAFPLFCFLLVEGFLHTRDRGRYLLRLALFALLSEIPHDLAFRQTPLEFASQNVFFTLALGLAAMWAWAALTGESSCRVSLGRAAAAGAVSAACMAAAWAAHAEYGWYGVLLILVLYLFRDRPRLRDLCAAAVLSAIWWLGKGWWIEIFAILALPLLHLYSGERGKQSKTFFYLFYPSHLLLLSLLRQIILSA